MSTARRGLNVRAWAHHTNEKALLDALRAAPHRYDAVLLAAMGAPVRVTDEARRLVVVALVRAALPARIDATKALTVLCTHLESVDEAFVSFEPDDEDVRQVFGARRGGYSAAAWLLRRAGACGVPRRSEPSRDKIEQTVLALRQAERRARRKGLRES